MAEQSEKSVSIPWSTIAALFALLGGIFFVLPPLISSRPPSRFGPEQNAFGQQNIPARLWQDPLEAVARDPATKPTRGPDPHDPWRLRKEIGRDRNDSKSIVMPVMIAGGPYAEYSEQRIRTRVAVLEALGASGFVPHDGEHLGYVVAQRAPRAMTFKELVKAFPIYGPPPPLKGEEIYEQFRVPYEWCDTQLEDTGLGKNKIRHVLIFWLRDEAFGDAPLARLEEFLRSIGIGSALSDVHPAVKILGPRSSTSLRAMVDEAARYENTPRHERSWSALREAEMYASNPTASDELLLYGKKFSALPEPTVKALVEAVAPIHFARTITPDNLIMAELIDELARRGVNVTAPPAVDGKWSTTPDHVALISEADTFYGRALPVTFAQVATGQPLSQLLDASNAVWPPWIHRYEYLRGIDGKIPGGEDDKSIANKQPEAQGSILPRERPEGVDQSDYLRRLAAQLEHLDRRLKAESGFGLKAIGILGTDLYDKLMVMRALRERLPGAVFFTTNLDARLAYPDEWNATHNLVAVSSYGLTLDPNFQDTIAPFRDSYQTAVYVATLKAIGHMPLGLSPLPPRIFEIGRSGPHDLSLSSPVTKPTGPSTRTTTAKASAPLQALPAFRMHPVRPDMEVWLTTRRAHALVTLCLALLVLFIIWIFVPVGDLETFHWRRIFLLTTPALMLIAPMATLVVWLFYMSQRVDGEPFEWAQGISIWPTEIIRLIAGLLCIHFMCKTFWALFQNDMDLERDFHLKPPFKRSARLKYFPFRMLRRMNRFWWQITNFRAHWPSVNPFRSWDVMAGKRVDVQKLWDTYQWRGTLTARAIRILPPVIVYLVVGGGFIAVFGRPTVPYRGDEARSFDVMAIFFAVICQTVLTFTVVDAVRLNERFIYYLHKGITIWPKKAIREWGAKRATRKPETTEFLDTEIIAQRTAVVSNLLYYPFFILFLMIVSRVAYFDNWDWPPGLILIFGLNSGYAIASAIVMRRAAEDARATALGRLRRRHLDYLASGKDRRAALLLQAIENVKSDHRGAFAAFSRHPVLGAILLPSSGMGIWILVDYLIKLH